MASCVVRNAVSLKRLVYVDGHQAVIHQVLKPNPRPLLGTGLLVGGKLGLHSVGVLVFPACLIVAGLLLEPRTLLVLTVETVACVALILGAEVLGLVCDRPARGRGGP